MHPLRRIIDVAVNTTAGQGKKRKLSKVKALSKDVVTKRRRPRVEAEDGGDNEDDGDDGTSHFVCVCVCVCDHNF